MLDKEKSESVTAQRCVYGDMSSSRPFQSHCFHRAWPPPLSWRKSALRFISGCVTFCFLLFSFFSIPLNIFALLFSLPPSRNSDPGSHGRLFSPPTHYDSCLAFFIARRFQLFLPSSTRVELCLPTLAALSAVDLFFFCK